MTDKRGLLLVNLGSPQAPTKEAVRVYLAEFLHDYRVVDTSRWIWCPVLHGIILRTRPAKTAKVYESIWSEPDGKGGNAQTGWEEAPLIRITRAQTKAVAALLEDENVHVEMAMRYGQPSISFAFERFKENGITQIGVLPLYPQFAGATTASVFDGVAKAMKGQADVPELRFVRNYYKDPDYIATLGKSVKSHIEGLGWTPDLILASYHGLPQSYVDKGDPYQAECLETTQLLRDYLGYSEQQLRSTFQSRFGPKEWLRPYTDKTLEALPGQGVKNICVITPGFAADCLETLEEINIEGRESFMEHGGQNFSFIPCLNAQEDHVALLAKIAREKLLS